MHAFQYQFSIIIYRMLNGFSSAEVKAAQRRLRHHNQLAFYLALHLLG